MPGFAFRLHHWKEREQKQIWFLLPLEDSYGKALTQIYPVVMGKHTEH